MHYHKCAQELPNNQVCGQVVAVCAGEGCEQEHDHYCSIHHPDPSHRVEPTPPLKR